MIRRWAFPTLAGVLLLLAASAPASAGHTETHVQEYEEVFVSNAFVYVGANATVDCAPQDATLGDPSCEADANRVGSPQVCMPTLGWGCTDLI